MNAICKTEPSVGLALCEVPEPVPRYGEVLVRVSRTSLCGTDLHIYQWDSWAQSRLKPPLIIGHEFCGHVVAVGEGVESLQVGDFVAGESHIVCGQCKPCREGQAHVCLNTRILGVDTDGCFAPLITLPAQNAQRTDPRIPPEVATVQDPLGNAVHTVLSGEVAGRSVLVTGCGAIGLFSIAVARACGAERIFSTEVRSYRRELALRMGADCVWDPTCEDVTHALMKATNGVGVDVGLEMSGHPSAIELLTRAIRPGGRISLLGLFAGPALVDLNTLIFKSVTIHAILGRRLYQTWETMQSLLLSGKLDVRPIITHELAWHEYERAFELLASGTAGKVILNWEDA